MDNAFAAMNKAFSGLEITTKDENEKKDKMGGATSAEKKDQYHPLRLGFHTNKGDFKGIVEPLLADSKQLKEMHFRPAAQIFTQVPQTSQFSKIEDPAVIMQVAQKQDLSLVIHSPYSINDFWKKNDLTKLNNSLENAQKFVAADVSSGVPHFRGIVVHLPKATPENVTNVIKNRTYNDVPILLENHAYKPGPDSYELPSKLNKLTKLLTENKTPNWGYCIDTAHLFVCISQADRLAGYKIEQRSAMERWLGELTAETRDRIKCWHLNGSVNLASSYDDKHAIPIFGTGHRLNTHSPDQMWGALLMRNEIISDGLDDIIKDQLESLQDCSIIPILKHAMKYDIPVILEINRGNNDDIGACLKMFHAIENAIHKNNDF
jgi:endonuclease IV